MFNLEFFLKGLLVGIIVSAPMGPIGVLCVQKTVNKGQLLGFFSGLGAATADTFYAILAVFGVTFLTNFLAKNQLFLQVVGITVLLILGFRMIFNNPIKQYRYNRASSKKTSAIKDYLSVFFLTISNPLTIIFFGAAFAMLGLLFDFFCGCYCGCLAPFDGLLCVAFCLLGPNLLFARDAQSFQTC
jgi:threonine/homoserine/homoserine lactone efflux protein